MLSFHAIFMLLIHACSAQSIRPILAAIMCLIKSISPHAATDLSDFSIRNEGLGAVRNISNELFMFISSLRNECGSALYI